MRISDWSSDVCSSDLDYFKIGREFLVVTDPPKHTQLKRIFSQPFTPKRVAALTDSTKALVDSEIDRFVEQGTVDNDSEFAHRVPLAIISSLKIGRAECRERVCQYV